MIKSIAFDLGDTLILITEGFHKTLASKVEFNLLKKMNSNLVYDKYLEAVKKGLKRLETMKPSEKYRIGMPVYVLLEELQMDVSWEKAVDISESFFEEQKKHTKLFPGVIETLDRLKKDGYVIGIISNAGYEKATKWLDFYDIKKYFDIFSISSELNTEKSGLEPFKDYLEKAKEKGIRSEEILMIGNDMLEDTSAKKLGMKVAILKQTISHKKNEIEPDYYIEELAEIPKLVKTID